MSTTKRKPGFIVIETRFVQDDHLKFAAVVIRVTLLADLAFVGVVTTLLRHLSGNSLVAGQTLCRTDADAHFMASGAVGQTIDFAMVCREVSGAQETTQSLRQGATHQK